MKTTTVGNCKPCNGTGMKWVMGMQVVCKDCGGERNSK